MTVYVLFEINKKTKEESIVGVYDSEAAKAIENSYSGRSDVSVKTVLYCLLSFDEVDV